MPKIINTEFKKELVPAGSYFVRLVQIVDCGTQEREWNGNKTEIRRIRLTFELPTETYSFEKDWEKKEGVKLKTEEFSLSWADKSNLRKFITAWLGEQNVDNGLDIGSFLWKCGIGTIQHETYAEGTKVIDKIVAVSPLMKGMKEEKVVTEKLYFDLDNYDDKVFQKLPQWVKDKIMKSPEYEKATTMNTDWDLPFN